MPREQDLKITFLIRSDTYMQEAFGEYAYCARVSYDFLDGLRSAGHEIGWHPHLWRWSGKWFAELNSSEFMRDCLVNGFNSLHDYFEATSVRTGWDFMSNEFMSVLESLGVRRDFSALPGTRYQEPIYGMGYDWLGTSTTFYYPSRDDYRKAGIADFRVLEMPITLTEKPPPVRWVVMLMDRHRGARRTTTRHEGINLAKHPLFNKNGFERVLSEEKDRGAGYILAYFHPSDIVSQGLFSMKNLERNIRYLIARCKEEKSDFTMMTAGEAAEDFLEAHGRTLGAQEAS
jgi:hypothetical protein